MPNVNKLLLAIVGATLFTTACVPEFPAPDTTAPTLAQVTPVPTPSDNTTPSYTFSSNEAGTIIYGGSCSSATTTAVNGSNVVIFNTLAEGTYSNCTIRVKDAKNNTSAALAVSSFTIDIPPATIPFVALLSSGNSQVLFDAEADGYEFYRSTDPDCELGNYASCTLGQMNVVASSGVTDGVLTTSRAAYYWLKRTQGTSNAFYIQNKNPDFTARNFTQVVHFNSKLWMLGGFDGTNWLDDVWSSEDGITWVQESASAGYGARAGHQAVVFQGKIWIIGGVNNGNSMSSVQSSSDGIHWTVSASLPSAISSHEALVFNGKLWVIGGWANGVSWHDNVYSSDDGTSWTLVTAAPGFAGRSGHASLVFDNKMWVIGGNGFLTYFSDVWSSTDGLTWVEESAAGNGGSNLPEQLNSHQALVYNNKIWITGGADAGLGVSQVGTVYSSADGKSWTLEAGGTAFGSRDAHQAYEFGGAYWVATGRNGNANDAKNDLWRSTDMVNWRKPVAGTITFE